MTANIKKTRKFPNVPNLDIELQNIINQINSAFLTLPVGGTATTAGIELQNNGTYIQWRQVGTVTWNNLVALTTITGPTGATGAVGPGVPTGGTAGQILSKIDGVDFNTHWITPSLVAGLALASVMGLSVTQVSGLSNFSVITTIVAS